MKLNRLALVATLALGIANATPSEDRICNSALQNDNQNASAFAFIYRPWVQIYGANGGVTQGLCNHTTKALRSANFVYSNCNSKILAKFDSAQRRQFNDVLNEVYTKCQMQLGY